MTQGEVLKLLGKSKKMLSVKEIAEKLGKNSSSIGTNVKKLRDRGNIKFTMKKLNSNSRYIYVYFV